LFGIYERDNWSKSPNPASWVKESETVVVQIRVPEAGQLTLIEAGYAAMAPVREERNRCGLKVGSGNQYGPSVPAHALFPLLVLGALLRVAPLERTFVKIEGRGGHPFPKG
jgi:hypothetical protein